MYGTPLDTDRRSDVFCRISFHDIFTYVLVHGAESALGVGLSEVISSSTKDQILRFLDIIVKVVQDALCDDEESVRQWQHQVFKTCTLLSAVEPWTRLCPL
jgi:hypothetical protein